MSERFPKPDLPPEPVDLTRAEAFAQSWNMSDVMRPGGSETEDWWSYKQALEYVSQEEVMAYLDECSLLMEKIYSRMPKYVAILKIMQFMATATTATEKSAVFNSFSKWFDSTPPPSNNEIADQMMAQLEKAQERSQENG